MKKLLLLLTLAVTINAFSQVDLSEYDEMNYFDQIKNIETTINGICIKDSLSEKQLKRYNRYRAYWDSRIDRNGSHLSYLQAWQQYYSQNQNKTLSISDLSFEPLGPFESMTRPKISLQF